MDYNECTEEQCIRLIQDMLQAKNGGAPTQKPKQKKSVEFHCETLD